MNKMKRQRKENFQLRKVVTKGKFNIHLSHKKSDSVTEEITEKMSNDEELVNCWGWRFYPQLTFPLHHIISIIFKYIAVLQVFAEKAWNVIPKLFLLCVTKQPSGRKSFKDDVEWVAKLQAVQKILSTTNNDFDDDDECTHTRFFYLPEELFSFPSLSPAHPSIKYFSLWFIVFALFIWKRM